MCGRANPSPGMLRRLYGVRRTKAEERVMPAEVKVLGWSKGERSGMVVRGGGRDTVRVGGRVPLGEGVEYVYSRSLWSTGWNPYPSTLRPIMYSLLFVVQCCLVVDIFNSISDALRRPLYR